MQTFSPKIQLFSRMFLVLSCFSFNLFAQSIQPLGIRIGNYSILPGKASSINTYCIDRDISTVRGTLYTQISIGRNALISIGDEEYLLQDAIDKGYVSFTYKDSVNEQMKMSIKNHTNSMAKLNVKEDLVLSDVPDGQNIKSRFALNTNIAQYKIPRQQIIWFSHFFDNYLSTYGNKLNKNKIIGSSEEVSVEGYLKIRDQFLKNNGIADRTLIAKNQSKDLEIDYTMDKLLSAKEDINHFNGTGQSLYILRFMKSASNNYYYLEDGSSAPFKTQSIVALMDEIRLGKSNNAIMIVNENIPAVKRALLIQNLKRIGIPVISEINELGNGSVIPFITNGPNIVSVSKIDVYKSIDIGVDDSYSFQVKYRIKTNDIHLSSTENLLELESASKDYLTVMSKWFKSLLGKVNSSKSMGEIYRESKRVADRVFIGKQTKVQIVSNYSSLQYSNAPIHPKQLPSFNRVLYAYN